MAESHFRICCKYSEQGPEDCPSRHHESYALLIGVPPLHLVLHREVILKMICKMADALAKEGASKVFSRSVASCGTPKGKIAETITKWPADKTLEG